MRLTATAFALLVPIMVNAASDFDGTCPPNQWVDVGCEVNPYLCQIKCPNGEICASTPDIAPCSGADGSAPMDAKKCREVCEESRKSGVQGDPNIDICRFWRYESVTTSEASVKTCTLLSSSQCEAPEQCEGDCVCGDVGCPGENPENPEPPLISCQGGIEYKFGSDFIHWACVNIFEPEIPSPYHEGSVLPSDTICTTTHQCSDWDDEVGQKLTVNCDGLTGKWVQNTGDPDTPDNHHNEVLGSQPAALLEHRCDGKRAEATLTVVITDMGSGAQLSCEDPATPDPVAPAPPTAYKILAPNKCVLLCDFHLGMVFESRLNAVGEFKFYIIADTETEITSGDMIKCWPGEA